MHGIVDLMGVEAGWIFLLEPDTGQFRLAADVNLPAALAVASKRRMVGDCRCISRLREGQFAEAVNLIECLRLEQALPRQPESYRHASVPLIAQDQTVGILNLLLPSGRAFSGEELSMLEFRPIVITRYNKSGEIWRDSRGSAGLPVGGSPDEQHGSGIVRQEPRGDAAGPDRRHA